MYTIKVKKMSVLKYGLPAMLIFFAGCEATPLNQEKVSIPAVSVTANDPQIINMSAADIQPEFPGGTTKWAKFMLGYQYPAAARNNKVEGKLLLSFIVEKDGSLSNIAVERNIGFGTGEEAVRLMKTSPKWTPGMKDGHAVRVKYTQPIKLALN